MKQCQIKVRDFLIEDGMVAAEAVEAVQPPPSAIECARPCESDEEDDPENPHKLRKCFISLKRVGYIEEATKRGCRSILLVPKSNSYQAKFIW